MKENMCTIILWSPYCEHFGRWAPYDYVYDILGYHRSLCYYIWYLYAYIMCTMAIHRVLTIYFVFFFCEILMVVCNENQSTKIIFFPEDMNQEIEIWLIEFYCFFFSFMFSSIFLSFFAYQKLFPLLYLNKCYVHIMVEYIYMFMYMWYKYTMP